MVPKCELSLMCCWISDGSLGALGDREVSSAHALTEGGKVGGVCGILHSTVYSVGIVDI